MDQQEQQSVNGTDPVQPFTEWVYPFNREYDAIIVKDANGKCVSSRRLYKK
jgi:ABC-type transporter lipoprotein component MlaA